jgi:prolyl oligopeptidase
MKKNHRSLFTFFFVAAVLAAGAVAGAQSLTAPSGSARAGGDPKLVYPVTRKVEQVDDYFGTKVPDPYRWLEDETSPETKAWVDEENRLTFSYLDKIPYREKLKARLTQLYNYPRIGAPFHRGDTYFFTKNDGLQNQNVYYIQKGVNGKP